MVKVKSSFLTQADIKEAYSQLNEEQGVRLTP